MVPLQKKEQLRGIKGLCNKRFLMTSSKLCRQFLRIFRDVFIVLKKSRIMIECYIDAIKMLTKG